MAPLQGDLMKILATPNNSKEKALCDMFVQVAQLPQCIHANGYGDNKSLNAAINMHNGQALVLFRSTFLFASGELKAALCVPPSYVGGQTPQTTYLALDMTQLEKTLEVWSAQAKILGLGDLPSKSIDPEDTP